MKKLRKLVVHSSRFYIFGVVSAECTLCDLYEHTIVVSLALLLHHLLFEFRSQPESKSRHMAWHTAAKRSTVFIHRSSACVLLSKSPEPLSNPRTLNPEPLKYPSSKPYSSLKGTFRGTVNNDKSPT